MKSMESTKWQWAYQNQLILLDSHDAYWIECASNKWKGKADVEEFEKFLSSYSLRRGKIATYFKEGKNVKHFITRCNKVFSPKLEGSIWNEAQARWNKLNNEFNVKIGSTPASATMKAFWFYHPALLPMYDQYVKKSLNSKVEATVTIKNYLIEFGSYYESIKQEHLDLADKNSQRKYISLPRVADKYLWLVGNKDCERIIKNYLKGLELTT